jgi:XTP/dITP diphosphohydrolase
MEIVFATNNKNKLSEIQSLLKKNKSFRIIGLRDIGFDEELPETGNTLEANASQKANHIFDKYGYNCFADDSGLEVEALEGRPGVYSARYAGGRRNDFENMQKVLTELQGHTNRSARFRTVIALVINGVERHFEGEVRGIILESPRGTNGFGYDPVFQPEGFSKSFAEMGMEEKNSISHRAKAVKELTDYLGKMNTAV